MTDSIYMEMAFSLSRLSKCTSLQVACLLVKNGRVLSTGVNGTPSGYTNCSEAKFDDHHSWSLRYEIHAELNAIIWAAREGTSIAQATAYITHSPCEQCTKNLIAAGIKRIVYAKQYKRTLVQDELKEFCLDNNVMLDKLDTDIEEYT